MPPTDRRSDSTRLVNFERKIFKKFSKFFPFFLVTNESLVFSSYYYRRRSEKRFGVFVVLRIG
jgi:hypothetical protein